MKQLRSYIFILIGAAVLSSYSVWDKQGYLLWRENFKLTWKNFTNRQQSPNKYAAESSLHLLMKYNSSGDTCCFVSKAFFSVNDSWYVKEYVNDRSLQHEQLHFDLMEVYARFFRRTAGKTTFFHSSYKAQFSKLEDVVCREWDKADSLYDQQTDHSWIIKKQKEWNAAVKNMLRQNEMYSDTLVKVVLRK